MDTIHCIFFISHFLTHMKTPNSLYSRLALITSVTLVIGYFVVYAWAGLNLSDVDAGDTITASLMQGIVNKINDIGTRTDGIYNNGIAWPTATPSQVRIGWADYSNTAWSNLKLELFNNGAGTIYGFGVSGGRLDYVAPSTAAHVFYNNGMESMRITSSGAVGIGTTTPTVPLSVAGAIRVNSNNSANPVCNATTNGSLWFSQGATGVADSLKVCAKDATNTFLWRVLY